MVTTLFADITCGGKQGAGGEIQLTHAFLGLCRQRKMYGCEFEAVRYDLGDRADFLTAQIGYGLKRPELADRLRAWLKTVRI
jgi:UTP--glucose-1-phosphate uridylyltransferase